MLHSHMIIRITLITRPQSLPARWLLLARILTIAGPVEYFLISFKTTEIDTIKNQAKDSMKHRLYKECFEMKVTHDSLFYDHFWPFFAPFCRLRFRPIKHFKMTIWTLVWTSDLWKMNIHHSKANSSLFPTSMYLQWHF